MQENSPQHIHFFLENRQYQIDLGNDKAFSSLYLIEIFLKISSLVAYCCFECYRHSAGKLKGGPTYQSCSQQAPQCSCLRPPSVAEPWWLLHSNVWKCCNHNDCTPPPLPLKQPIETIWNAICQKILKGAPCHSAWLSLASGIHKVSMRHPEEKLYI